MSSLPIIPPYSVANKISTDNIQLVDVREKDEFAREHIRGAMSSPLSSWSEGVPCFTGDKTIVFLCRSGMRTNANCAKLAGHVSGTAYILDGGLDNWKKQGFDSLRDTSAPLEVNRQVQMIAGGLVLTGAILGITLHPLFIGLSAFVGAGLFFAGASGWCGMATLLRHMPWNKSAPSSTS